jgi:hypothetical protein
MADLELRSRLVGDVSGWNAWRARNPDLVPDLSGVDLRDADLRDAYLGRMNLAGADLSRANLCNAKLGRADLSGANLTRCDLERASLVDAKLAGTQLVGCTVYGVNAWNLDLTGARQDDLIITPADEPVVTVDDLEVAQFIYLLLNNQKIRAVIETVTAKAVLILGRFTPERKAVLDAVRALLREHGLLPILFDFDKPASRTILETVTTLARLARFIVADITDPKSIPQELAEIVKALPSVPVQPILQEGFEPWSMFESVAVYPWVLDLVWYRDLADLLDKLPTAVLRPAEEKAAELGARLGALRRSLGGG